MEWLTENWQGILGGGTITSIVAYIVNRDNNKADFLTKVESLYNGLADTLKVENNELKEEILGFKKDFKQIREDYRVLQEQFNSIQLAYAMEVERSQNWEKLHRELTEKYNALEKDHEALKSFCEKIKIELDKYKKINKPNEKN